MLAQFGPLAVFGGQVPYGVMLRVQTVNAILSAHADSRKALNLVEWTQSHPELRDLLGSARLAYEELNPADDEH